MYRIQASESMKSGHFSQSQTPGVAGLFPFSAGQNGKMREGCLGSVSSSVIEDIKCSHGLLFVPIRSEGAILSSQEKKSCIPIEGMQE
jgi:hypothetical protein